MPTLADSEDPSKRYLSFFPLSMIPQSKGTVTLASADARDPPVSDPKLFSNAFDRVNMINAVRNALRLFEFPALKKDIVGPLVKPASDSVEDVWEHIKATTSTA